MNITGWFLGDVLSYHGTHLSEAWCYPLAAFFVLLFLVYPFRSEKKLRHYYAWKRTADALMIVATFCFILVRGNNFNNSSPSSGLGTAGYASTVTNTVIEPTQKTKKEKKNAIKKFVQDLRKKYKGLSKRDKTGFIILAILVAILLVFGLFSLTCSLACSGAEGLAYVVLFLGLGGIIFGFVRVIERITKGPRKKKQPEPKSS